MAEVLDGKSHDGRRAVVGVGVPRQLDAGFSHFQHVGPGRRSGERGRLRSPMEDDARIGGNLDDEVGVPGGLACLAGRLARV